MIYENSTDAIPYQYKWFFYDCIWEGNKIIFAASNCNAICEMDISTGSTCIIEVADEEKDIFLSHGIYKWKEYIILPDRNAKPGLHLFNLTSREWSYIAVEDSRKGWMNFREEGVFEYNGYLYIFPSALVVLKVDIEKKSIDYIFYPDMKPEDDCRGEIAFIDDTVYIPTKHGVNIHKFDLTSEQWEIVEVKTDLKGIDTLCYDGRQFWMSGVGRMICSWDEEKNVSVSFYDFPQGFCKLEEIAESAAREDEDGWWFGESFLYGESIFFLPNDANMLIEFDTETKEIRELSIAGEEETQESLERKGRFSAVKYMGAKQKDNLLMMLSNKNKNLILLDLRTKKAKKIELRIYSESEWDKIISTKRTMYEGLLNLQVWLKKVINKENQYNVQQQREIVGKKIYSTDRFEK